ncbi:MULTISPECIES: hypothetical protein [Mycolicibacter]|uniref:Uncharacterized protein n=1 Tax=Mycolicibacter longobardus TaxID=1108812 RepID=A0A1X1YBG8_9MYCO|nr:MULTISPECIES: hypothetical protein [Mycolicibacter]ORW08447.1 hypothetical protein AWC16_18780 [Mycolicibacter longobardus]
MNLYGEYHGPADEKDLALLAERQRNRDTLAAEHDGFNPLCGDVVEFPTGEQLRISHVWPGADGAAASIQTSRGGSWYWSNTGDMSFSGSLYTAIPAESLSPTGKTATVDTWIFHHDLMSAHRGVAVTAQVLMWATAANAPF